MKYFACLLDPLGHGLSEDLCRRYDSYPRSRGLKPHWEHVPNAAMLTAWDDPYGDALIARGVDYFAIGSARLDNRSEVERWLDREGCGLTDLELGSLGIAAQGPQFISRLLGDFCLVLWRPAARTAVVACDALAVRKLYYARRHGLFLFASRADGLAIDDRYCSSYLAERIAMSVPSPDSTPFEGIYRVPPGTLATLERDRLSLKQYWCAEDYAAEEPRAVWLPDAADLCRDLLTNAVRLRMTSDGTTWAQLSGGVDSSSIVCIAQGLGARVTGQHGLGGTITFVDQAGTDADERAYAAAVIDRWPVRNEQIIDPPFWYEAGVAPPCLDQPLDTLPFYPREARLCTAVRRGGGRVLLTGFGGDELFTGSLLFVADWLAKGQVVRAVRELASRAAAGRASFWGAAYRNALLPFLPNAVRHKALPSDCRILPWICTSAARRYGLAEKLIAAHFYAGPMRRKYRHVITTAVAVFSRSFDPGMLGDAFDVRHPFLYRPLVEFALGLPASLVAKPFARKWILREAMRGILPEAVRTRVGKGSVGQLMVSALTSYRCVLEPLLREPMLADLGLVDATKLRDAFRLALTRPQDSGGLHAAIQLTLTVEAWLQLRSGRWPCGAMQSTYKSASSQTPSLRGPPRRTI